MIDQNVKANNFKLNTPPTEAYCQHALAYKQQSRLYRFIKRTIDLFGAITGMLIFAPLFLLIALAIFLEDGRPIFFSQTRVGRNGKPFRLLKFRSMVVNAEDLKEGLLKNSDVSGKIFKMKNDPRLTRVGRYIRQTSLDEIPQFINVLQGQMSLVGPRPAIYYEVADYTSEECQRVLPVKPGLSGLSQVHERLNKKKLNFAEQLHFDLRYIEQQSILLDLLIILKTPYAILMGRGE